MIYDFVYADDLIAKVNPVKKDESLRFGPISIGVRPRRLQEGEVGAEQGRLVQFSSNIQWSCNLPALHLVSKQLYGETISHHYKWTTFVFSRPEHVRWLCQSFTARPERLDMIVSVSVDISMDVRCEAMETIPLVLDAMPNIEEIHLVSREPEIKQPSRRQMMARRLGNSSGVIPVNHVNHYTPSYDLWANPLIHGIPGVWSRALKPLKQFKHLKRVNLELGFTKNEEWNSGISIQIHATK